MHGRESGAAPDLGYCSTPSKAAMTYLRYLWYVLRHKWWVLYYSRAVRADVWLCLWHDMSKFSRAEFGPYARWFYGEHGVNAPHASTSAQAKEAFRSAWNHHKTRNRHHPEYWCLDAHGYAIPMPERYVREMIADWMGAGRAITGKMDVHMWWASNRQRFEVPIQMHENTVRRVEAILSEIA
jgi:hypothetical protein